jgi:inner membrane protein
VLPDADVIGYHWLYVPYSSFLGHRGFFHSPFFAALGSLFVIFTFFRQKAAVGKRGWLFLYFFILTASHGILDAMTNGGYGIALLSPLSNQRYFLPWTPLEVSPLGVNAFFSQRGLTVLRNEFIWIWVPSILAAIALISLRKNKRIP